MEKSRKKKSPPDQGELDQALSSLTRASGPLTMGWQDPPHSCLPYSGHHDTRTAGSARSKLYRMTRLLYQTSLSCYENVETTLREAGRGKPRGPAGA